MKVAVGIVLYNPNVDYLIKSLEEVYDLAADIYLVDNHSRNIDQIRDSISKFEHITFISNSENLGIAGALNQVLKVSWANQDDFLITLDQDSILKKDSIQKMLYFHDLKNVAMICPVINDVNKQLKIPIKNDFVEIDRCITSGSIMNLKICKEIGLFDEQMFIDYVDFDYCKRIRLKGKKIIRAEDSILDHQIGKRSKRHFLFWTVFPTNHDEQRVYYYVRNIYYYLRKFHKKLTIQEKMIEYKYLLWKLVGIVLYEQNKMQKWNAFFRGKWDSKKMKIR